METMPAIRRPTLQSVKLPETQESMSAFWPICAVRKSGVAYSKEDALSFKQDRL
jgi:hypothetical protein